MYSINCFDLWHLHNTKLMNMKASNFNNRSRQEYFTVSHYIDVVMTTMASQITSLTVVYSTVYSDADQGKHQNSASLAFVWGIHRDRWIPRTKGQLRGKYFHLMTSTCHTDQMAGKCLQLELCNGLSSMSSLGNVRNVRWPLDTTIHCNLFLSNYLHSNVV